MPIDCHAQGKRKFGNIDPPRAKIDISAPAPTDTTAAKKKNVRYTMGREAIDKKETREEKSFGTAKGSSAKRKQPIKKRKKRPKRAE